MLNLLHIEYKKLIPYSTFWVIFGLFFLFTPIVFFGIGQLGNENFPIDLTALYKFPKVWNNITYIASWFNLLIGILMVILVCNEFLFKTFRQHIIDGQSRADFIVSKILLMTSFAILCTTYLLIVGGLFGLFAGGGGSPTEQLSYLFVYFVQTLGYMSVGLVVAIFIRSSALSIIIFIFSILAESIIRTIVPDAIDQYFPMKIISNLTPIPTPEGAMVEQVKSAIVPEIMALNASLFYALLYIIAFWGMAYFRLTKKDIN